jgi:flavin-binding protein dodecin
VADHVYKSIEVTGSSDVDLETAIRGAIGKASQSVRNINWFEVKGIRGHVDEGSVAHFQVTLNIGFRLE